MRIVRREKIRYLLSEIDESLTLIRNNLPENQDLNDFLALGLLKDGLYKRLEYVLQSIFDICAILNRDLKLGIPQNDEDILTNLAKIEIIDARLLDTLRNMKGMRNILVHQYGRINDEIIFEVLMTKIDDIEFFCQSIVKLLDSNQK
ncbi:DUF86 domain-containing protein [Methanospirillum stamsii]|uniref:DUF86 domain-containing protein n=2 Tax=Methanospirillum stamsii TaxID=1277351 RepID=A0A2V2MQS9_9EURY|nr:DUF86 domain-containing protein [Methanospirillum stamsii]